MAQHDSSGKKKNGLMTITLSNGLNNQDKITWSTSKMFVLLIGINNKSKLIRNNFVNSYKVVFYLKI